MYDGQVPSSRSEDLPRRLVACATELMAGPEEVTLRRVAAAAGTSTMAVYTHFGGMPGLWRAVRQEGFTRLADRLAAVERTDDPVRDVAAFCAAYLAHGLADRPVYLAMFDARADLEDGPAADAAFGVLVEALARSRDAGRLAADTDPEAAAVHLWALGHGLLMLVLRGVLPADGLPALVPGMVETVLVGLGDDAAAARRSVAAGMPR